MTKEISVFVDESGSFDHSDFASRYYLICLVFHDQESDISAAITHFEGELANLGLSPSHCVHAGPLIRREQEYRSHTRDERRQIFAKMLAFTRKADITYRCFSMDKRFLTSTVSMHDTILQQILAFLIAHSEMLNSYEKLKIYYDNGQAQVTSILKEAFAPFASRTEFVPNVAPAKFRLFQVADLLCTIELARLKLASDTRLTDSEIAFFGSIQNLRKNYIKPLSRKCLN